MSLDTAQLPKANILLYIPGDRHQPFLPESLHESLDQPQTPGANTDQENYNPTSQARLDPVNIWARVLPTSMLMKLSGHLRIYIQLYQEPALPTGRLAVSHLMSWPHQGRAWQQPYRKPATPTRPPTMVSPSQQKDPRSPCGDIFRA